MFYLLLAILSSASVALVLKLFSAQTGNRYAILLGNYITCVAIALLTLPERGSLLHAARPTLLCGLCAGILFVFGFVSMQSSIRANGASLTSAFSKLGLLVSLALSVFCFGERLGGLQLLALPFVFAAIFFINGGSDESRGRSDAPMLGLLLLTLLCSGFSDSMAKVYEFFGPGGEETQYCFFLFLCSTVLTAVLLLRERFRKGRPVLLPELAAGILLGIPNYYSAYFLLHALERLPAYLVYSMCSTGVILLVLALSALFFHERLGKRQMIGMLCILIALVLLNV